MSFFFFGKEEMMYFSFPERKVPKEAGKGAPLTPHRSLGSSLLSENSIFGGSTGLREKLPCTDE